MAGENKVSIKVLLDSKDAQRELDELQAKIRSILNGVQSNRDALNGSAGFASTSEVGTSSSSTQSKTVSGTSQAGTTVQEVASASGNVVGSKETPSDSNGKGGKNGKGGNDDNSGDKLGRGFVNSILRAGIGMLVARQFLRAYSLYSMTQTHAGQSTYDINMNKAMVNGGVNGAIGGASIGAVVAGPVGALVGGLLGGIGNMLMAQKEQQEKQRLFSENTMLGFRVSNADSMRGAMSSMSSQAFQQRINLTSSRDERLGAYAERIEDFIIALDDSENKIKEYTTKGITKVKYEEELMAVSTGMGFSQKMVPTGRKIKKEYQEIQDENSELVKGERKNADSYRANVIETLMGQFNEAYLRNQLTPWMGSDFSDSYSSKGISIGGGAGFDVGKANDPVLNVLEDIRSVLKTLEQVSKTPEQISTEQLYEFARKVTTYGN